MAGKLRKKMSQHPPIAVDCHRKQQQTNYVRYASMAALRARRFHTIINYALVIDSMRALLSHLHIVSTVIDIDSSVIRSSHINHFIWVSIHGFDQLCSISMALDVGPSNIRQCFAHIDYGLNRRVWATARTKVSQIAFVCLYDRDI